MRICTAATTILVLSAPPMLAEAQSPTFQRSDMAATSSPRSVVTADFNRDGRPDLALCGSGRKSVVVLLNNGAGGFALASELVVGGGPFELAAGDLNRDGIPDLVVANADADAVDILIGAGNGTFSWLSTVGILGGNPRGVTIADYDRDGRPDIIVTEYATGAWRILYGDGTGAVARQSRYGGIKNPQGVIAADFNHDGRLDVAMAGAGINIVAVFYSTPSGGLVQTNVYVAGAVNVLAAADYDHDGWLDLFAASTSNSAIYTLHGGSTGLAWQGTTATGSSPRSIDAADLNQDGGIDLITADRSANTVTILVGRSGASGRFDAITVPAGTGSRDTALADFDHDGRLDLATANEFGQSTTILWNQTALVAPAYAFERLPNDELWYADVRAVVDVNENGKPDLVMRDGVLIDGTRTVWPSSNYQGELMTAADLNRDGHADLVAAHGDTIAIVFGDGAGRLTMGPSYKLALGRIRQVAVADMNRDGREDLVVVSGDASGDNDLVDVRVLLGQGNGTFVPGGASRTLNAWALRIRDFNRDGIPDVMLMRHTSFAVLTGDGKGGFAASRTIEATRVVGGFEVGDLNHDDILDIVAADGTFEHAALSVYLGRSDGGFNGPVDYVTSRDPQAFWSGHDLSIADLNNDGNLDVLTRLGSLLPGRGDGTLGEPEEFDIYSEGAPFIADYNGDGLLDVLSGSYNWGGIALNRRAAVNRPPVVSIVPQNPERAYGDFFDFDDQWELWASASDPDLHALRYEWRSGDGRSLGYRPSAYPNLGTGVHQVRVTVSDARGASKTAETTMTIHPHKETWYYAYSAMTFGNWRSVADSTAAGGYRMWNPNANLPKVTTPLANPVHYIEFPVLADATQQYKLWIRMKAEGNGTGNDSVWVQITGAVDAAGQAIEPGTTAALAVNLEECAGCGIAGWGWEDDGWGAVNKNGVTLRFAKSGVQWVRIQTREDGVSIDQFVLSAEKYKTARPGTAKNDTTKLDWWGPWLGCWDRCSP